MAAGQYLSLPAAATGLAPASGATAWTYGSWVQVTASATEGMLIAGIEFTVPTSPAAADTTYEQLFEIGTGAGGAEVVKVQTPFSYRADTITSANNGLGYWMPRVFRIYFPEPFKVTQGTRVAVRATDSIASAITYAGVKVLYKASESPTVALNTPADTATITDTTPTLNFTGTDAEADDIRYEVQVDSANTFDSSLGTEAVDQQQTSTGTNFGFGQFAAVRYRGQVFTCGATGQLTKIGFNRTKGSQGIKVYIDTVDGSNLPAHAVGSELYSFTITNANVIDQYGEYTVPVPPTLTAGTKYVIYLAPWDTSGNAYADDYQDLHGTNSTTGGVTEVTYSGGWSTENLCFNYKTYITPAVPLLDKISGTDAGFSGSPDNSDPFASAQAVDFTVQAGDALPDGTYYWRVRGIDPTGSNAYGAWATTRNFILQTSVTVTPPVLSDTATIQAPTVTAKRNVSTTATELTGTGSLQTATFKQTTRASATVLTESGAIQSPGVTARQNSIAAATALDAILATVSPSVTVTASVTANPAALSATGSVQVPAIKGSAISQISHIPVTITIDGPTVTAIKNITSIPAAMAATGSLQAPGVITTKNVTINPSTTTIAAQPQAPSVSAAIGVTATPSPVTATGSAEASSESGGASVQPSPEVATATIQAATVITASNILVQAGEAQLNLSVNPVVVQSQSNVTIAVNDLLSALEVNGASVSGQGIAQVAEAAISASLEDPTIVTDVQHISVTVHATVGQLLSALQQANPIGYRRRGLYTFRVPYEVMGAAIQTGRALLYKNNPQPLYN